jgi:hypothetical protein
MEPEKNLMGTELMPSGRWRARRRTKNKMIYLGTYDTPEEAHAAYLLSLSGGLPIVLKKITQEQRNLLHQTLDSLIDQEKPDRAGIYSIREKLPGVEGVIQIWLRRLPG